jgi:hypothetical protein
MVIDNESIIQQKCWTILSPATSNNEPEIKVSDIKGSLARYDWKSIIRAMAGKSIE